MVAVLPHSEWAASQVPATKLTEHWGQLPSLALRQVNRHRCGLIGQEVSSHSLNLAQVQSHLRRDVEMAGGQSEWSRQTGVTRSHLNRVLRGQKPIGPQISRALGLRKVTSPTDVEVRQLLRREILKAGSQAEW